MAFPIFQRTIVDTRGNVITGASITVRSELTDELATLYVDRELTEVKPNPFVTDTTGLAQFYVARGDYRVRAFFDDEEIIWRYVQLLDTQYIVQADDNNNVGIGGDTSGVVAGVPVTSKFCIKNEGNQPVAGFVHVNNTTANSGSVTFACRSRGTLAAPTIVQNNDALWHMYVAGGDGTDLALAAQISVEVDGTPGNNDMPGRLVIHTTPNNSQIPVERLRITSAGAWGLAGTNYGTSDTQAIVSNGNAAPTWQTVVTPTATQTLTNKTLTSPTINGGTITGITDLLVADGGTGRSSLTANNVLLGNGTSSVNFVAPGVAGNVLTSDGTTWTSSPAGGGAVSVSATAPVGPLDGALWFDTSTLVFKIYYSGVWRNTAAYV